MRTMMAKAAAERTQRRGSLLRPPADPTRRALRPRRSPPLLHDYYGFSSSESESELEERGRRKLKLVLKLATAPVKREGAPPPPSPLRSQRTPAAVRHGSPSSSPDPPSYVEDEEEKSEEEEEAIKPPKKRRIDGCEELTSLEGSHHQERRRNNAVPRSRDSVAVSRMQLPERKTLGAILDKLQKLDTYRVFAVPVDPVELPDYHDVIEHPMDFGTVRKKLARSVYRSFEQFEDDVFLICSNAMQYNAPDTIYFRQAHSIQDMARKKFRKLRDDGISTKNECKNEEKFRSDSSKKQPPQKPGDKGISTDNEQKNEERSQPDSCKKQSPQKRRDKDIPSENEWKNEERSRPDSCKKQPPHKHRDNGISTENEWKNEERSPSGSCKMQPPHKPRDIGISTENEWKDEQKKRANSHEKHPLKKSISRTGQEPQSSMSSAATLASTGEICTGLSNTLSGGVEPPVVVNGNLENSSSLGESKLEKADELPARDSPTMPACKLVLVDENRRDTYSLSDQQQSLAEYDFFYDIVASKPWQLGSVGFDAEYAYARSLAWFAASLGPIAWKIASEHIEKALPAGVKFGQGWVGEYEPLPTSVLSHDNRSHHWLGHNSSSCDKVSPGRAVAHEASKATTNSNSKSIPWGLQSHVISKKIDRESNPKQEGVGWESTELCRRLRNATPDPQPRSNEVSLQQKNEKAMANFANVLRMADVHTKKSTLSSLSSDPVDPIPRQTECPEGAASRRYERAPSSKNNGPGFKTRPGNMVAGIDLGGSSDGKVSRSSDTSRFINDMGFISKHPAGMVGSFLSHGGQQNGNNSAKLMGLSSPVFGQSYNTNEGTPSANKPLLSFASMDLEQRNSSSASPAQSWINFGASSESKQTVENPGFLLLNQASPGWRNHNTDSRARDDSKMMTTPFFRHPVQMVNGEPRSNYWGSVIPPQFIATGVSRPHGCHQWQGLGPQNQQKQNKDTLRPDLNVGFQCPESPARQSLGINLEAQQPDLALQL